MLRDLIARPRRLATLLVLFALVAFSSGCNAATVRHPNGATADSAAVNEV
jgi:hypothetical protein